jgi:hypothetical protein
MAHDQRAIGKVCEKLDVTAGMDILSPDRDHRNANALGPRQLDD